VKERIKGEDFDLNTKPGIIQVASPDRSKMEEFNHVVAMNADRFIFARDRNAWVEALLDASRASGLPRYYAHAVLCACRVQMDTIQAWFCG
jgi:hypothetical protein